VAVVVVVVGVVVRPRATAAADGGAFGLAIDQLVAWGTLYYAYGVLAVPLAIELGLALEMVAAGASVSLLVSATVARPIGRAIDRGHARMVMLVGAGVGALALLLVAGARVPAVAALGCVLLGIAQATSLYDVAFARIFARATEPRARARGLLIVTTIAGLASTVFVPLTTAWVDAIGWRAATVALVGVQLAVMLPLRLRRDRDAAEPRDGATSRDGRRPSGLAWITAGFALQAFATTGIGVTLLWRLLDGGATAGAAAWSVALVGVSQLPGRWLSAPLQRWCAPAWRVPLLLIVHAASVVVIGGASGPLFAAALVVFGATSGMMTLERATIVLAQVGIADFGRGSGEVAEAVAITRAAAPWAVVATAAAIGWAVAYAALAVVLVVAALALRRRRTITTCVSAACENPGTRAAGARRPPPG